MGDKIRNLMRGRYGVDQLNQGLFILSLCFLFIGIFAGNFFTILALLLMAVAYFRTFSRKIGKRYGENQLYLRYLNKIKGILWQKKQRRQARKTHHFYKCPNCKQKVRVPKGVGKIAIHCPKCNSEFVKKS